MKPTLQRIALLPLVLVLSSCVVNKYAIRQVNEAVSGVGTTFASDDDPELIRAAAPFSLKLVEALIEKSPRHEGLLLAAAQGFTQYAYAFVEEDADEAQDKDPARAAALRAEAAKLFIRARNYGLRGIEVRHKDFTARLRANPKEAVKELKKSDVPLAYWTTLAWAAALSASRDIMMLPEIPRFEALADRVLQLDEAYDEGAMHGFLITYEMSRPRPKANRLAVAKTHFERNLALAHGHQAAPYVFYAESVVVAEKDRAGFQQMLRTALKIDVNAWPEHRQLNLVMQRRARWLLSRTDTLFPASRP